MAKLYFMYGAMNSGKSTRLMQDVHNFKERDQKVLVIKSSIDKKAGSKLSSRIGIELDVDILLEEKETLGSYQDKLLNVNAIFVDEAQFLTETQVEELWKIAKIMDIRVFCYGLKSDFKTKLFPGSRRLFELADVLTELKTICRCGNTARFNGRIINGKFVNEGAQVSIDGIDAEYESLCGKCYLKKVKKITYQKNS